RVALSSGKIKDRVKDHVKIFVNQLTSVNGCNRHEIAFAVHTQSKRASLGEITECVFHLISVSVPAETAFYTLCSVRLDAFFLKKAQYLIFFDSELFFIRYPLIDAPSA